MKKTTGGSYEYHLGYQEASNIIVNEDHTQTAIDRYTGMGEYFLRRAAVLKEHALVNVLKRKTG